MMEEQDITFIKRNGRIIPIKRKRFVETGKSPNYNTKYAKKAISQEISSMVHEVKSSQKSSSYLSRDQYGTVTNRHYTASTFPKYFSSVGANSSSDFEKIANSKKGVRYDRIKTEAIDRLENGFKNSHGYNDPDAKFLVKTGKYYDNKDIIFRKVKGVVRPLRVPKKNRYDLMEEAPF